MGGNNITDVQSLNNYGRSPVVFMVSLICFLSSNLFAFMIRIFKNSIPLVNMNIIILINYSIAEIYNITVTIMVCFSSFYMFITNFTNKIQLQICYKITGFVKTIHPLQGLTNDVC